MNHTRTALSPPTTRLIVRLGAPEQEAHDHLLRYLRDRQTWPRFQRDSVLTMLDLTTGAKAIALRGFLGTLQPDQPTMVFCRNRHEESLASLHAQEAGFRPTADPGTWYERGGVLVLRADKKRAAPPDLSKALYAIFLGRPPSKAIYQAMQDLAAPKGHCPPPYLVHLIAHGTIDKTIADQLLQPPR